MGGGVPCPPPSVWPAPLLGRVFFPPPSLLLEFWSEWYMNFGVSGTGVRQSQARLEKPGGATRQGCGLGMSVSRIVHDLNGPLMSSSGAVIVAVLRPGPFPKWA